MPAENTMYLISVSLTNVTEEQTDSPADANALGHL